MGTVDPSPVGAPVKRRWCGCSKEDFFPEESFKSWANYGRSLGETGTRLVDRITSRSPEAEEMTLVRARSVNYMKRTLSRWDLLWLGFGVVMGAGIFVLTGQEASADAGPSVIISFVISGVAAMLSVFCYAEFAVEIPVAGGSFAYLRVELGDFVAFIGAGNIVLEYIISNAAVARAWTSYFATLLNHDPDDFRIHVSSFAADYSRLDLIAVAVVAATCLVAVLSTKWTSRFNYIASMVHVVVILFIIIAGLTKADGKNLKPFTPYGGRGMFTASAVLFFAYVGFDAVSTMAEETKNPARDIPVALVGSVAITTVAYVLMALTLCLMQPYTEISPLAPFPVAFSAVGLDWAKYIVAFGALKGMTTVLLVSAVGQGRYLTHIARTHMVPPWLAHVNKKTSTPINATVTMAVPAGVIALFTDLPILANLLSIATLFIFMLVAVALLVRRHYAAGESAPFDRNKFLFFMGLIGASSIGAGVYWAVNDNGYVGYAIAAPLWFVATAGMWLWVPQAKKPRLWGVPLVPWLPSAAVFINIFLLASIDGKSWMRFGIWSGALLLYYFFMGLHASYDTAKASKERTEAVKMEEGGSVSVVATPSTAMPNGGCGGGGRVIPQENIASVEVEKKQPLAI